MTDVFDELIALLRAHREELRSAVDSVPESLREVRADGERWSAAEVLDHLALIETMIAGLLTQFAADAPPRAETRELPPIIDLSRMAARSRRVPAVPGSEPRHGITTAEAWQRLEAARANLLAIIERVRTRDVDGMTHPHFIIGPLDAREWISFVAWHEIRHANQIREFAS
jgi:hypothetical protein